MRNLDCDECLQVSGADQTTTEVIYFSSQPPSAEDALSFQMSLGAFYGMGLGFVAYASLVGSSNVSIATGVGCAALGGVIGALAAPALVLGVNYTISSLYGLGKSLYL